MQRFMVRVRTKEGKLVEIEIREVKNYLQARAKAERFACGGEIMSIREVKAKGARNVEQAE